MHQQEASKQEHSAHLHRRHDRDEFRPWHDVRPRILLLSPNCLVPGSATMASFGFQVSAAIGGGFVPVIATAMVGYFGGTPGVSIMMVVLALIALAARETRGASLT